MCCIYIVLYVLIGDSVLALSQLYIVLLSESSSVRTGAALEIVRKARWSSFRSGGHHTQYLIRTNPTVHKG